MITRKTFAALGLGLAMTVAGAAAPVAAAQAEPQIQLNDGVYRPGDAPLIEKTQFIWGGRNYCWYGGGWHGPGWYWCGYAWHRGYGWGGPVGWHGWRYGPGPYRRGYYDHYRHWRHY